MDEAASVILACRRLLAQQTETEARAAVAACDVWLDKYQYTQPRLVSRKPCRVPTELVISILRHFRRKEDRKTTLLTCRLVNKEWQQLAWTRFWYTVTDHSAQGAASRLLHRWAVDVLKGVQVRKLQIAGSNRGIGVLLAGAMMGGIRMLSVPQIKASQLFVIFRSLPWLVALEVEVVWVDSVEGASMDDQECEGGNVWRQLWKDNDRAIWKAGFGNLKSLSIDVEWDAHNDAALDFVDTMAASLGTELKSLSVGMTTEPPTLNSFLHKLAGRCPNLKDFEVSQSSGDLPQFPHFLESLPYLVHLSLTFGVTDLMILAATKCVHLKYLTILDYDSEQVTYESIRHLANGPFLKYFEYDWDGENPDDSPKEEHFESFLKERGRCLEVLKAQIKNANDRTLDKLLSFCPNLRELDCRTYTNVTEEGVVAFLKGSQKLERIALPYHLRKNEAVLEAANARDVGLDELFADSYLGGWRSIGWVGKGIGRGS
ncbi:hypothetical protein HK104_002549 [Borealophlyctis nickersoniae]|nr:hypothetical protein HK104_002549 [Borealophlyctis nickersoniae]